MLLCPTVYFITTGHGEGPYELNAFDAALLNAGIGNLNLLRVSSILPPGCEMVSSIDIRPGSLVPVVYGRATSSVPGTLLSAAIGVGIVKGQFGLIMETSGNRPKHESEELVKRMIIEGASTRGLKLREIHVRAVEHTVVNTGCVLAAVAFWWR